MKYINIKKPSLKNYNLKGLESRRTILKTPKQPGKMTKSIYCLIALSWDMTNVNLYLGTCKCYTSEINYKNWVQLE